MMAKPDKQQLSAAKRLEAAPLLSALEDDATFHEANGLVLRNLRIANILDCPSISLSLPLDGVPIGLMLIGRRNADRRLLEIASSIEAALQPSKHASDIVPLPIGN